MSLQTVERVGAQRPRLSQWPARAVGSAGDDAIEFAERIGWDESEQRGHYVLDDWQKFCIRGLLSEDESAQLCALVSLLLVTRQNGKNVVLEVVELYAFFVLDLPYILHTAHLQETTAVHMGRVWAAISSDPELSSMSRQVTANGKERIWRTDTPVPFEIKFRTRSPKTGRGPSPRMVVFDEALHLTDDQIQAILPSLSAQTMRGDAPILIYTSSAPIETSEVLHRLRRSVLDGQMPDAFFAEWSTEVKAEPGESDDAAMRRVADDVDAWFASNPGMGVRISSEWVQSTEKPQMSLRAFLIERLGVVFELDDDARHPIPADVWAAALDPDSRIESHRAWAVSVSPDRKWAAIGVAGRTASGRLHVEWMHHEPGTAWVAPAVVAGWQSKRIPIRVHRSGPEGSLIVPLREAGVEVVEVSSAEVSQATGQLIDAATCGGLRHVGQRALDVSLRGAVLRVSADGASMWSQRQSDVEITPLQAVTVAVGGVPDTGSMVFAGGLTPLADYDDDDEEW